MKIYLLVLFVALLVGPHAIEAKPNKLISIPDCSQYDDGETLPDSSSCSQYYMCVGGKALRQRCARGLYFDALSGLCNRAFLVDCHLNLLRPIVDDISNNRPDVELELHIGSKGQERDDLLPCDKAKETTTCATTTTTPCSTTTTTCTTTSTTTPCTTTTTKTTSTTTTTCTTTTKTTTTTCTTTTTKTTTTKTTTTTCTTTTTKTTTTKTTTTKTTTTKTTTTTCTTTTSTTCTTTTSTTCTTTTTCSTTTTKAPCDAVTVTTTCSTTKAPCTTTKAPCTTTKAPCTTTKAPCTTTTTCSTTKAPCTTTTCSPNSNNGDNNRNIEFPPYLSSSKDCQTLPDGTILLDHNHCRRYYICSNQRTKRYRCPARQWFDQKTLSCRPRDDVTNCAAGRN